MILHVMPAEKFVDRAIDLFELAFPGNNEFWIFSYQEDGSDFNYVKTGESAKVKYFTMEQPWWNLGRHALKDYSCLFFHNLYSPANIHFALRMPKTTEKHVIIWGHEFYGFVEFWPEPKFGQLTLSLGKNDTVAKPAAFAKLWGKGIRGVRLLFDSKYRAFYPSIADRTNAYKGIDYIHTHVREDYRNIISRMYDQKAHKPNWSHFSYYSTSDFFQDPTVERADRILVGNSATATNNHLEVFQFLENLNIGHEILCPLNYGDENYAQLIMAEGEKRFGSRFKPLLEFVPLEDYNALISSCSIVLMNHYRQQAAGNIITSLLAGSKVFLSRRSPLYTHFNEMGISVLSIEDHLNENELRNPITLEIANRNRDQIRAHYSKQYIVKCLQQTIQFES